MFMSCSRWSISDERSLPPPASTHAHTRAHTHVRARKRGHKEAANAHEGRYVSLAWQSGLRVVAAGMWTAGTGWMWQRGCGSVIISIVIVSAMGRAPTRREERDDISSHEQHPHALLEIVLVGERDELLLHVLRLLRRLCHLTGDERGGQVVVADVAVGAEVAAEVAVATEGGGRRLPHPTTLTPSSDAAFLCQNSASAMSPAAEAFAFSDRAICSLRPLMPSSLRLRGGWGIGGALLRL